MIEFASSNRGAEYARTALRHAPRRIVDAVNRARHLAGLSPLDRNDDEDDSGRACVWWDPDSRARPPGAPLLISPPAGGKAASLRSSGGGPLVDRVLLVAAYGDATAQAVGRSNPETILRQAFGPAAQLNGERGWGIVCPDHSSPVIQFGGPASKGRLRAIDSEVGLVLDWLPDPADRRHMEAVRMIQAGAGCSVLMKVQERSTLALSKPVDVVRRARLVHVCIGHNPAYRGAAAMLFRNVRRDDAAQFAEQLAAVAREAQFRDRKGRGHVG